MTAFSIFTECPLLIAHCIGVRLIAISQRKADPRLAVWAFVVVLIGMVAGCASLPESVQRPVSLARTDLGDTRLASMVAASTRPDGLHLSGMRLLPAGDQSFEARIALAKAAEKTIDAQYYLVADDASGRQFLRELRDAASRGVRVRLLLDDLHAAGSDAWLAGLAAYPNVELRLFNPLPVRDDSVVSRVLFSVHQFSRINRRMHNKLLVADNAFAIGGGRNIADEYFGRSEPVNFIDMDLLLAGAVVQELSAVFDGYWNSDHAYPIQSLAPHDFSLEAARRRFDEFVQQPASASAAVAARDALGQTAVGVQLAEGRVELHWAPVRVFADVPGKAGAAGASLADGAVMNGKLELLQSARSEVLLASPYFIPDRRTLGILGEAAERHVRVSVMTNSLGTTDEPLVHFGYARHRSALLRLGVSLYELMPGPDGGRAAGESTGSLGRLHAKVAVVDQRWLYIGSMNMDRRSAHSNTELGLVVDSPELAGQVASLLQRERLPMSYQVRSREGRQGLQWVAAQEGREQAVLNVEPNSSWGLRLRMSVLSTFIDEELL